MEERKAAERPSIAWIDAGRIVAILAVIVIHVVASLTAELERPLDWWFGNIADSAARWSVPVFVMLSGALLLRSANTDSVLDFYRRRLNRIGIPLVVWTVVYLVVSDLRAAHPLPVGDSLDLVVLGKPYYHMYFIYLIAGLYVVAPFLRPLVRVGDSRLLGIGAAVFLLIGAVDLIARTWTGIGQPNAVTRFVPFIGYFLAGAFLVEVAPSRPRIALAAAILIGSIVATAAGTYLLSAAGSHEAFYLYGYLSASTIPASLAAFLLLSWSEPLLSRLTARRRGWLAAVAAATFGIYLVHPLILMELDDRGLSARSFLAPVASLVVLVITFGLALVVVLPAQRLPILRRIL